MSFFFTDAVYRIRYTVYGAAYTRPVKGEKMNEKKIKLVVKSSKCDYYREGDEICLEGALIQKEKSANLCLTALSAIFPFVYAARKGVTKEQMGFEELTFQCPDGPERVMFSIECDE